MSPAEQIWRFEMTEAYKGSGVGVIAAPGDTFRALLLRDDGTGIGLDPYDEAFITVHDTLNLWSGAYIVGEQGARGWCIWRGDTRQWEVLGPRNYSQLYRCASDWDYDGDGRMYVNAIHLDGGLDDISSVAPEVKIYIQYQYGFNDVTPEIYEGYVISVVIDNSNKFRAESYFFHSPIGGIQFTPQQPSPGYVECDGSAYPADKKIGDTNAPDYRDKFIFGGGGVGYGAGSIEHTHDNHTLSGGVQAEAGLGAGFVSTQVSNHSDASHIPPNKDIKVWIKYK